ncbi:hypothetical protein [Lederbergia lenta]|uniref:hypothetical protein n=1 Tax=Lederbergia lenta TaxID=1467 RepID=UPI002040431F|nr:hypothetical protein [Lederbergia lenta]MCM3109940.1 hypothetical protein [Lederbergia lenta]
MKKTIVATIELVVTAELKMEFELFKQRLSYMNVDGGELFLTQGGHVHKLKVEALNDVEWDCEDEE